MKFQAAFLASSTILCFASLLVGVLVPEDWAKVMGVAGGAGILIYCLIKIWKLLYETFKDNPL